jgi:hypothetical protein
MAGPHRPALVLASSMSLLSAFILAVRAHELFVDAIQSILDECLSHLDLVHFATQWTLHVDGFGPYFAEALRILRFDVNPSWRFLLGYGTPET